MGLVANRVKKHVNESKDPSMIATFNSYFGSTLGEQLPRQTDNVGRALHNPSTSAAQGNTLAQDVAKPC